MTDEEVHEVARRAMARGFGRVVRGRALLADPDFVHRLAAGEDVVTRCDHCNLCVAEMDLDGVRCVLPPRGATSPPSSP